MSTSPVKDKDAKELHEKIRQNATPSQRAMLEAADRDFNAEIADFENRFEYENKLRAWAKDLMGYSLLVSDIENLLKKSKTVKNGQLFIFDNTILIKTQTGSLDRADRYVNILEKTVIDIMSNSQFTTLNFYGLITLAFKRLFRRK